MKRRLHYFLLLIIFLSCENNDIGSEPDVLKIRIHNATPFTFEDMEVNTSGGLHTYARIEPGETSRYENFDFAFSIAFIEFRIGTKTFTFQPYDYVGETLFEEGLLTYSIQVTNFEQGQFSIDAIHK